MLHAGVKIVSSPKHLHGNDGKSKIEPARRRHGDRGDVMIPAAGELSVAEGAAAYPRGPVGLQTTPL